MQPIYIPVGPDKRPLVPWRGKEIEAIDDATREDWADRCRASWGRAVPTGDASGLLCIDFDADAGRLYTAFAKALGDAAAGLLRCVIQTPSGGYHVWLRVVGGAIEGNRKLAYVAAKNDMGREIAIETRGTGGYAIVPPTPGYTPIGEAYDVYDAPVIGAHEVLGILQIARDLCEAPLDRNQRQAEQKAPQRPSPGANSVIDIYNQTPIEDVLREHGYIIVGNRARRPGGSSLSVTINRDQNRAYHHSSNDDMSDGYWHRPFSYAVRFLYGGDVRMAVRELAEELQIAYEPLTPDEGPAYGGLRVVRSDKLDEVADVTYLVKNMVPYGGLTMFYGPSGSGKSFYAVDLGLRLAHQGQRVVYLAGEGAGGYRARVAAWSRHHGMSRDGHPNLYFVLEQLSLHQDDTLGRVMAMLDEIRPALLIIDTLGQSAAGLDILAAKDAMLYLRALGEIQHRQGVAILLIHHTNKGNTDTHTGSQYFVNNADAVYALTPSERGDGQILLECRKLKDGAKPPMQSFRLVSVAESAVMVPADQILEMPVRTLGDNHVKVLSMLALAHFGDGANATAIERHTGLTAQALNYALDQLKRRGLIEQAKSSFRISQSGHTALREHGVLDGPPPPAYEAPEGYATNHRDSLLRLVRAGDRGAAWAYVEQLPEAERPRWTNTLIAMLEAGDDDDIE